MPLPNNAPAARKHLRVIALVLVLIGLAILFAVRPLRNPDLDQSWWLHPTGLGLLVAGLLLAAITSR